MARQVQRSVSKYHLVICLGAICLTSLTSAKNALSAAIGDDQWKSNTTGTVEGADFEDRAGHYTSDMANAINEFRTSLTRPKNGEVKSTSTAIDKLKVTENDKVWKLLEVRDGRNLLTDSSFLNRWDNYVKKRWGDANPLELLYVLLKAKFGLTRLLEDTVKGLNDRHRSAGAHAIRRWLLNDYSLDGISVDGLYSHFQLDMNPGPLENPFLSIWSLFAFSEYVPISDQVKKIASYYRTDEARGRAIATARGKQEDFILDDLQENLFKYWQKKGLSTSTIREYLEPSGSLTQESADKFLMAWDLYQQEHEGVVGKVTRFIRKKPRS